MSDFKVGYTHVNQFHLVHVEDQDTGLTYEVYFHTLPLPGGGNDLQAIVDPVSVSGGTLWKCWLREIETPRVDDLREKLRIRQRVELPGEEVRGHLRVMDHIPEVVADVLEAYHRVKWVVIPGPSERKSRYQRNPVI